MPTPPNMLRARTRGITRLSWSMTKVRKLELTGTRPDVQVFGVRLRMALKLRRPALPGAPVIKPHTDECGRTNAILPRRSRAASFKRLLGSGLGHRRQARCPSWIGEHD